MTLDLEEEVLLYVKHLLKGGDKFSYTFARGRQTFKVTKVPLLKGKPRSRSRSKSRPPQERLGPMGLGKGKRGSKYVMRKKSIISRPATEGTAIVRREREWQSGSDSEGPEGRLLALPAPEYVEIKPSKSSSDGDEGSGSDNGGGGGRGGGGGGRGGGPAGGGGPGGSDVDYYGGRGDDYGPGRDDESVIAIETPETRRAERDHDDSRRTRSHFERRATYRNSRVTDLDERKRLIEARIEREQEEAMSLLERADEPSRIARQDHLREDARLSQKQKEDIDEDYDIIDTMRYLDMMYGLIITPAGDRPEVDNGEIDTDTEEVHYDPEMSRTDRLRAETSLPTMRAHFESERRHGHESSYRHMPYSTFERSRTQPMYDRFRYMSYPPMPYPRSPFGSGDEEDYLKREVDIDEPGRRRPNRGHPRHYSYNDVEDSHYPEFRPYDDDHRRSYADRGPPPIIIQPEEKGKAPRRPTYHSDHSEEELEVRRRERKAPADTRKSAMKKKRDQEREIHIIDASLSPEGGPPSELRRRSSYGGREHPVREDLSRSRERDRFEGRRLEIRRPDDDLGPYMRGARGEDSDDEDREMFLVRK